MCGRYQLVLPLEEVLAELHDPYFVSPTIIARLRGATPPNHPLHATYTR